MLLEKVLISEEDEIKLYRHLGNWLKLSEFLAKANEDEVIKLLKIEVTGRARLDIVHRLHSRYSALRKERERKEITTHIHKTQEQ